ncbi:nicotinamide-nucleotide amidohydrolase family protein [Pedobacter sp.]|uniref:CinA family protein n=1 Tax=Pedobacter sp. TaxID=1411316 RepID=UPI0031CF76F3
MDKVLIAKATIFNNELKSKGLTIIAAESITAGLLASTIASVSGASAVLKGSIVTYSENLKMNLLDVNPLTLGSYTAESRQTTDEMCLGLKKLYPEVSIHVAITGVASTPVDDNYKIINPVGQVFLSILYAGKLYRFEQKIEGDEVDQRNSIRANTVIYILEKVLEIITEKLN